MTWTVRTLTPAELDAAHALRQQALHVAPSAFGSSPDDAQESRAAWAALLAGACVYGGFDADGRLRGMAGLGLNRRAKARHKGYMWGVYVEAGAQGRGLGRALVAHVVEQARGRVEWLDTAVAADNAAALHVYEAAGFARYGTEPAALRVDGRDVATHLLTLKL